MKRILFSLFAFIGLFTMIPAQASADELHRINGFRSAHFGMSIENVRSAIARDFAIQDANITVFDNDKEATRLLSITLPELEPGPGRAHVYYIFGATTQKLMHVNVIWAIDDPTEEQRNHIAVGGVQLTRYFAERKWKPDGVVTGVSLKPTEVMLFAGVDPADAGVEVVVSGVPMTGADGKTAVPSGPAILRLSYMARYGQPDVISVEPGEF